MSANYCGEVTLARLPILHFSHSDLVQLLVEPCGQAAGIVSGSWRALRIGLKSSANHFSSNMGLSWLGEVQNAGGFKTLVRGEPTGGPCIAHHHVNPSALEAMLGVVRLVVEHQELVLWALA